MKSEDADESERPIPEDDGLTLEQAVLRALARRSDAETMDQLRKTRLLRHIERSADWAREHLASAEAKLDPELQRLVDEAVEDVLTEAGGEE